MTDNQKEQIAKLREGGLGYGEIAVRTGLTKENVRYYCKTHDLAGQKSFIQPVDGDTQHCRFCGKPIVSKVGRRRLYCSEECRRSWWKAHPESSKPREEAIHTITCKCCGKVFTTWGQHNRVYCSHACYIKSRFGEKR